MIVSVAAGSTAIVITLPAWGFAALNSYGYVDKLNLPIARKRALEALKANVAPGDVTWLYFIEAAMLDHADTQDSLNLLYNDSFWEDDSSIWLFIQDTLAATLGSFSDAQLAALKTQARNLP